MKQLIATVLRFAVMWYMMSYFKGGQQQPAGAAVPAGAAAPLYQKGDLIDMYVYLSESPIFNVRDRANAELIWTQLEIPLAAGPERTGSFVYRPTEVRRASRQRGLMGVAGAAGVAAAQFAERAPSCLALAHSCCQF